MERGRVSSSERRGWRGEHGAQASSGGESGRVSVRSSEREGRGKGSSEREEKAESAGREKDTSLIFLSFEIQMLRRFLLNNRRNCHSYVGYLQETDVT